MRILELSTFSAGGCGVWRRVQQEATLLAARDHEVYVFSTNRVKGTNEIALPEEKQGNVSIKRFSALKLGGESFMYWNCLSAIILLNPEVIIAHSYRHYQMVLAIRAKKKLGCRIFLVTHAPFGRENSRKLIENLIVSLYDLFIGPFKLKNFDKIITISHWEQTYLQKLDVPPEKCLYLPNGIDTAFFSKTKVGSGKEALLFLGRIAPIKQLETVLEAINSLPPSKRVPLTIFGPGEKEYISFLNSQISRLGLQEVVTLRDTIYTAQEARNLLDKHRYFILPSKSEGSPQALVEAMARGRIVIGSDNPGIAELVKQNYTGFLYPVGDSSALANILISLHSSKEKNTLLGKHAYAYARTFLWAPIIDKLEKEIGLKI